MSWLAVDVGARRTGVAISWSGQLASPYRVLTGSLEGQAQALVAIIAQEQIHTLVFGRPRLVLPSAHPVIQLAKRVRALLADRGLATTLAYVDETLTTKEAERLTGRRRAATDQLAAQLILRQYLREQEAIDAE